jgi:di/tricarboxylate transporter
MDYVRGIFISFCIALGGAGGAVIAANLSTSSPRLMMAGLAGAVIGIIAGGVTLGRAFHRPFS